MSQQLPSKHYYYADGERIELTRADDLVAIDEQRLTRAAVPEAIRAELRKSAQSLRAGICLMRHDTLSPETLKLLREAGALQPVFRAQDALIIALPEVRVEERRAAGQRRLQKWIDSHRDQALVRSQVEGRIVLEPVSADGEDALAIANALTEEVKPEMAQARFLRVLPRPSTSR
jgi:hypothetical protein